MNTKIGIMTSLVLVAGALSIIGIQMANAVPTDENGIGGDQNYGECKKSLHPSDSTCKKHFTGGGPGESKNRNNR